jgi:predicted Zn-ribbon and HTH transcriptional regulator
MRSSLLQAKDSEIKSLKASMEFKEQLVERGGYKFRKNDEGQPIGNAFCPVCEQKDRKFYQLTMLNKAGRPYGCPSCKAEFINIPAFVDPR